MSHWKEQERKKDGRFSKLNPCEACGKSAGEAYFSHVKCNEWGQGVVLCESCAVMSADLLTLDGFQAFVRATKKAVKK